MRGNPNGQGRARRGGEGFTLIEVLVAMTALSLIMIVLYAGLRVTARGWDGGETLVRDGEMLRTSNDFLRRYLQTAYPLLRWTEGVWRLEFSGDDEQLRFVSAMPPHLGVGGLYAIQIASEERADGFALVLRRRLLHPDLDDRATEELPPGIFDQSVLAEGLGAISFDYFGATRANDPPAWQARWEDRKRLPDLVRMRVSDRHGVAWPELTVALRIDGVRRIRALELQPSPANPPPPTAPQTAVPGAPPGAVPGVTAPYPGGPPA